MHWIDPRVPAERTFTLLAAGQRQVLVQHLGLSDVTVADIQLARQLCSVASARNRYSLFDRAVELVLTYCRE